MYEEEKKEISSWFWWFFWRGLMLLILLAVIGFGLNSLGLFGKTVVEREVFEKSFQYSEARKSETATYRATLSEIERKLSSPGLDADTRNNLEAQASGIRIHLQSIEE